MTEGAFSVAASRGYELSAYVVIALLVLVLLIGVALSSAVIGSMVRQTWTGWRDRWRADVR